MAETARLPSVFISHGSPMLALADAPARHFLEGLGSQLPRPRAVLVVSAHWETAVPAVSAAPSPPTIHDFGGFPQALYDMDYPAPGAPGLAARVAELVPGMHLHPTRGLDHGSWIPLKLMYPLADLPVTQVSLVTPAGAKGAFALGRALAPLRDEGVLILASGTLGHSFEFARCANPPPHPWVVEFAEWIEARIGQGDFEAVVDYRARAPHAARNHRTQEHFLPLLTFLGTVAPGEAVKLIHRSYDLGSLNMDAWAVA